MDTLAEVIAELKEKGTEKGRATYVKHGMPPDRVLGVSIADLKVVAKRIRNNQDLAVELYETGIMDAMYLAGMVADGAKLSEEQLNRWVRQTEGMQMISEYTITAIATDHPNARELALKWIDSDSESVATSGWTTYAGILATRPDSELDLDEIRQLLGKAIQGSQTAKNRVRHTMNNFVISVGCYVKQLNEEAKETARQMGKVKVDMGKTSCKVPDAVAYIQKVESMGRLGQKRKSMRC
jgi:3-methyladenine DNA glycosylase AlkD